MIGYRFPPSGAVCLMMAPSRVPGEFIILNHWPDEHGGQWVVGHLATHHFPAPEEWYWGHYFGADHLRDAVECFAELSAVAPQETAVILRTIEMALKHIEAVVPQAAGLPSPTA